MDILVTLLRSPDSVTAVVIVSVSEMGILSGVSREGSADLDSLGRSRGQERPSSRITEVGSRKKS